MEIEITIGNIGKFQELFEEAVLQGMADAADKLAENAQEGLNRGYPPASSPGEYLARRSGDGRRSVFSQALTQDGKPVARCGSSDERLDTSGHRFNYMGHWERTSKGRRPWLTLAVTESINDMKVAFEQGCKDALDGLSDR